MRQAPDDLVGHPGFDVTGVFQMEECHHGGQNEYATEGHQRPEGLDFAVLFIQANMFRHGLNSLITNAGVQA